MAKIMFFYQMGQGDWEGAKKDNPFSQELLSNMKKTK